MVSGIVVAIGEDSSVSFGCIVSGDVDGVGVSGLAGVDEYVDGRGTLGVARTVDRRGGKVVLL